MSGFRQLYEAGRYDRCEKKCRQAIRRESGDFDAWLTLVMALYQQDKHLSVIEESHRALKTLTLEGKHKAVFFDMAGSAHQKRLQPEKALRCFEQACEFLPDHPGVLLNRVQVLLELNRRDECADITEMLLDSPKPVTDEQFSQALYYLSRSGDQYTATEVRDKYPRARSDIPASFYHAAMGEFSDREGDYAKALSHFSESNRLQRAASGYDVKDDLRLFTIYREIFDEAFFNESPFEWNRDAPTPVFIVGMPRSGSSLLEQMIGSHSRILPLGEVGWLQDFTQTPAGEKRQFVPARLKAQMLDRRYCHKIRQRYLAHTRDLDAGYTIDKLPANVQLMWVIHRVFPEALVIHTCRQKWPTLWSCFRTRFMEGNHFSESLDDCGHYYDAVVDMTRQWGPLMGKQFLEVAYETFVSDPVSGVDQVLERLGLAPEQQCYDPSLSKRVVRTASQAQVTRAVYRDANLNWQNYRDLVEAGDF